MRRYGIPWAGKVRAAEPRDTVTRQAQKKMASRVTMAPVLV